MIKRNWDIELVTEVSRVLEEPFDWAKSNCGHLMAVPIRVLLGPKALALTELTKFNDEKSAKALLAQNGGLSGLLDKYFHTVNRLSARSGDIGVVSGGGIQAGCIVIDGVAIGKGPETGVFRIPISSLTRVYRVQD